MVQRLRRRRGSTKRAEERARKMARERAKGRKRE
jgi:hypothetical protein